MEWLKNLSDVIDYVEKHLDDEISYDEAARIACCSTYYFQRMFSYVAGISLSEYIRKRRMSQAAFELQRTNLRVLDVALKYGYTSPTSFNRAFQSVHGISPTAAKKRDSILNAYPYTDNVFVAFVRGNNDAWGRSLSGDCINPFADCLCCTANFHRHTFIAGRKYDLPKQII